MLKRVPGIGPKGASRLLVELTGFVIDGNADDSDLSNHKLEASMALESLGFKKDVISKILNTCKSTIQVNWCEKHLKNYKNKVECE